MSSLIRFLLYVGNTNDSCWQCGTLVFRTEQQSFNVVMSVFYFSEYMLEGVVVCIISLGQSRIISQLYNLHPHVFIV